MPYALTAAIIYLAFSTTYRPIEEYRIVRFVVVLFFVPVVLKYALHLLVAPFYPVVESSQARRLRSAMLSVSVLIPAYNEEVGIQTTLRSVLATAYPHLEIIVINDGSTDRTHRLVVDFIRHQRKTQSSPATIRYRQIVNGGKARALNVGLSMAHGDIVITIDADSVMGKDAIVNMVRRFTHSRVASVAGNVAIGNKHGLLGLVQQLEYLYGFYFKRADALLNAVYIVGGAAAAYRRDVIEALGGFDEHTITEDIELSTRLQDHGYMVRYAADACVLTEGPETFSGLCRQRLRWKFGRLVTFYRYRHLFFSTDHHHSFFLSFVILPMALFAEFLLLLQGALLTIFYIYIVRTNDFIPLMVVIILLTCIIIWQILSDTQSRYHRNLFLLAPVAWFLFYLLDIVEYQALIRSMWNLHRRRRPLWQRWNRVGVFSAT